MTDSLQAEQDAEESNAVIADEVARIDDFIRDRVAIHGPTKAIDLINDGLERFELGME